MYVPLLDLPLFGTWSCGREWEDQLAIEQVGGLETG